MDGGQSPVDQWIMGAHRLPAAGGQPRNPKRKVDYFASMPAAARVVPDSWEEEVLPGAPDVGNPGMPRTDEVATDATDGAVAEGQTAIPPPEDMGVDSPPVGASPPRVPAPAAHQEEAAAWLRAPRERDGGHCGQ